MSAAILKFPREARVRTKAEQRKLESAFRATRKRFSEKTDREVWAMTDTGIAIKGELARIIERIETAPTIDLSDSLEILERVQQEKARIEAGGPANADSLLSQFALLVAKGVCTDNPSSAAMDPAWPIGKQGHDLEELARLGYASALRDGREDTMEAARIRVLGVWKGLTERRQR